MKIIVKKTLNGLQPINRFEDDNLQASKLKLGETYEVEIKKKRNLKHHQKFFVLINLAFENQDLFNNKEEFRAYVTMRSGFYNRIVTYKGEFFLPQSISFSKMDQQQFEDFYDKVFAFILEFLKCDNEELLNALKEF